MDRYYDTIKRALLEEDVEGLVESGAPADEYDSEALAIMSALKAIPNAALNHAAVASIIAAVWAESFERSEEEIKQRMPSFTRIAEKYLGEA